MGIKSLVRIAVVTVAIGLGILIKVPEAWFYTDFNSTPRPLGQASVHAVPNGINKELVKFACDDSEQQGWMCDGWLYIPTNELSLQNHKKQFPAIICAHGIGATKDMGLYKFAEKFASNGFIVLVFDYLHFGLSGGDPRHKINPFQHVRDWQSAIRYMESNKNVNNEAIGAWGTSYAGGHVLVTASKENSNLKAVVSQMPFLGPTPDESPMDELYKRGIGNVLKGMIGAISSKIRVRFGMTALYARLYGHVGDSDKLALNWWEMFEGNEEKWLEKHPKKRENDWRNAVLSDSLLDMVRYKPIQYVDKIDGESTKVLFVKAKFDKLCPNDRIDYAISKVSNCQSHTEDTTHFQMYSGKAFENVIQVQIDFFKQHLNPAKESMKVLD